LAAQERLTYVPASALALIHAGLGEQEECLGWMTRAIYERDPVIVTSLKTAMGYDPLHSHPTFQALLRKMNLEP
jgi:hypothetical protein